MTGHSAHNLPPGHPVVLRRIYDARAARTSRRFVARRRRPVISNQPASIDDTLKLLAARGEEAWILAGGMDSLDWLKDRTKRTSAVIELSQIAELHGIRDAGGGLEIDAMTTLTLPATT